MKKIINNPANFVEESIDGLIKSHPDVYSLAKDNNRVVMRANKASNKVELNKETSRYLKFSPTLM